MSVLNEASDRALETTLMLNGVAVEYGRDATTLQIRAVQGNNSFEELQDGTVVQATRLQEFLLPVAALGVLFPPVSGDRITCMHRVFAVMSPQGEQAWRFSGRSGNWCRIFSKQVA